MSSKRDLVEAHSFNRRRLVTAFVSGAPGGREVEPARYGRAIIGGTVLAALIVVGAAVGGMIKPKLPQDWDQKGVVIAKDSGARFISQKGTLFPVINTASARLVRADATGKMTVNTVPDDVIRSHPIGPTVGIAGAPDSLPSAPQLLDTGWTACVNKDGGLKVDVSAARDVTPASSQTLLVRSLGDVGQQFLVSGGTRFPISTRNGDNVLRTLGLSTTAFSASGSWVNLLTPGPEIKPFAVPGQGARVSTGVAGFDTVGTPVSQAGRKYLLVRSGTKPALLPISDFAYAVYTSGGPGAALRPADVTAAQLGGLRNVAVPSSLSFLTSWPSATPQPYRQSAPCLALTGNGDFRQTVLATVPSTSTRLPTDRTQSVAVDPGRGALVQETSGSVRSDQGSTVLVDATGTRYTVPTNAKGPLGYADVAAPSVSQAWTTLFKDGPTLDPGRAGGLASASGAGSGSGS
ncbi:MAG: eccB [Marmoricola sp.]|nr:eccB [Marmoricola sp.]